MTTNVGTTRLLVTVLLSLAVVGFAIVPTSPGAQPAGRWEFGPHQFMPPTTSGVTTRDIVAAVKLARVAVQKPLVAPGDTASLIAEYQVSAPQDAIEVKETRIIRFEGQQVAKLEKQVSVPRGAVGSTVALKVPGEAAPGLYTITTVVELKSSVATRGVTGGAAEDRANSVFRVQTRQGATTPPTSSGRDALPQLKLWTETPRQKIGEPVKISFRSDRDGYATLVNVGTSGKITILYPNAYAPDHAVKAGHTYSVPGSDDRYELTLGGPAGVELVYALFTTTPTRFVERNLTKERAFTVVNERAETITRDINLTVKKLPLKEQASAVLEIEVVP
jgi:Domain of unknown function (DUF4384)